MMNFVREDMLRQTDSNVRNRVKKYTNITNSSLNSCEYEICMKPVTSILKMTAINLFNMRNGRATFTVKLLFIYTIMVYVSVNSVCLYNWSEMFVIKDNNSFAFQMSWIKGIMDAFFTFTLPVTSWLENKHYVSYITDWKTFEVKFSETTKSLLILKSRRKIRILTGILLTSIFTYIVVFALLYYYLLDIIDTVTHFFLYMYKEVVIGMIIMQWYVTTLLIHDAAEQMFASFMKGLTGNMPVKVITRYSQLWLKLSELTVELGNCLCFTYCLLVVYLFAMVSFYIFWALYNVRKRDYEFVTDFILDATYKAFLIFLMGNSSHHVTKKITSGMVQILQKLEEDIHDPNIQETVYLFFRTIDTNPAEITLNGFVSVNRGLIVSMATTALTYLIILLQFDMAITSIPSEVKCNCTEQ